MPFSPHNTDKRSDYIFEGKMAAGAGLADGISGLFGGIAQGMEKSQSMRDESEGLSAAWDALSGEGFTTPEMDDAFFKGSHSAKQKLYAQTAAMAELERKRQIAQENMDYNAQKTQETSRFASEQRQREAQPEESRKLRQALDAFDYERRAALANGEITDAQNERLMAAPDPETGRKLFEAFRAQNVEQPAGPETFQAYPLKGSTQGGEIIIDKRTGQPVSSSSVMRPRSTGTSPFGGGVPMPIDPNQAAQGLPTVHTPTQGRPQMSDGVPLPQRAPEPIGMDAIFGQ